MGMKFITVSFSSRYKWSFTRLIVSANRSFLCQEELSYATKSDQLDLLQKVLAATDADAEEEQMTGVDWSTKKHKVQALVFFTNLTLVALVAKR